MEVWALWALIRSEGILARSVRGERMLTSGCSATTIWPSSRALTVRLATRPRRPLRRCPAISISQELHMRCGCALAG